MENDVEFVVGREESLGVWFISSLVILGTAICSSKGAELAYIYTYQLRLASRASALEEKIAITSGDTCL